MIGVFGLVVVVFGRCCTTSRFVRALLFWVLLVFWFALGCRCGIIYVAAVAGAMLEKLWVQVDAYLGCRIFWVKSWRVNFFYRPLYIWKSCFKRQLCGEL